VSDEHDREPSRTPVPLPPATLSDPHLGDAAKNPARTEGLIAIIFVVAIVFIAGFGAAYWQNWDPWVIGGTVGAGLFLLGFGLTAWGKYLMPQGPFVEERHVLASSPDERDSMAAALVERSAVVVKRRKLLGGLFAVGSGIFGIVALFPLLRSMGPVPGDSLDVTDWRKGTLLVDSNGRPVTKGTLVAGGVMTVYPHGLQDKPNGQAIDQTILVRVPGGNLVTAPGRETWAPEGYVAYSKLCTHLGCPVGLYEQQLELLVCPCHQSMFNVRNGAIPQFGPAPRPLPQLPLYFDSAGTLRAQAGFDQAVGPGFFERTTTKENGT
jgi:ubiquinol-cytochrome c reductase iron-sulfur subunit